MAERINLDAIERQVQRWVYPTVPVTDATGKPKLDANGSPVTRKSTAAEAQKLATSRMLWVGFAELLTARDDNGNLVADIGQRTAALVAESLSKAIAKRQTDAYSKRAKSDAAGDYTPKAAKLSFS